MVSKQSSKKAKQPRLKAAKKLAKPVNANPQKSCFGLNRCLPYAPAHLYYLRHISAIVTLRFLMLVTPFLTPASLQLP